MRNAIRFLIANLLLAATAFAGVTISSPAPGSTEASPVHFVASASSSATITAMRIYVDNVSVFQTSSNKIDTSISMAVGSRFVVVQAWDSTGAVFKASETITVTAPNKTEIQNMSGWQGCTICAGGGGNGPVAGFSMTQFQTSPSLSGSSAKFSIWGSNPYADALWWKQLGADDSATNFQYDLDFYITDPKVSQALEFDVNQSIGKLKFIFGTQCNIRGGGVWDVWDTAGRAWRSTGVSCPAPAAYKWHHLTWQLRRTSTQAIFVALTLDGVTHYLNLAYNVESSSVHELNVAFQMDLDNVPDPYSVWLDNVTLTYW